MTKLHTAKTRTEKCVKVGRHLNMLGTIYSYYIPVFH